MHSMTSLLRTLVALVSLTALAPTAFADGPNTAAPAKTPPAKTPRAATQPAMPPPVILAPIDLTKLPEACKPLAKQALSPTLTVALQSRISLASCMAERAVAPLELCDCGASIVAIDAAAAPAIALLDDVISNGDPAVQVLAEHAQGQLYAGFAIRMLATLPELSASAGDSERALRDMRKQTLEAQLVPWREAAMTAFQHVVDLAKAHPELAGNKAVTTAVRDSQQRLTAEVALR
jgi:hypothetical protein